jgi:putative transcriptional regulator
MSAAPTHHPIPDDLLAYATGRCDGAARAMVEAHLHLCAACAREVGRLTEPGGRLLRDLPVSAAPEGLLDRILDRLPPQAGSGPDEVPLPSHLLALLPEAAGRVWQTALGRGIRLLKVLGEEGVELFLVHLPPRVAFPHHAHRGREQALLLEGEAQVGEACFRTGDWAEFPAGSAHAPTAGGEGCWFLVRVEEGVRLSGWRGWLQRLVGEKK